MATTIKAFSHKSLDSLLEAIRTANQNGDFFDIRDWPRSLIPRRIFSAMPLADMVSTTTAPTGYTSPADMLYATPMPRRFGDFIHDYQEAINDSRVHGQLIATRTALKSWCHLNVVFEAQALVLSISSQSNSRTVTEGANVTLNVTAVNAASYQWQARASGGTTWSDVTFGTGATTSSFTMSNVTTGMSGSAYRCVVTGVTGSTPVTVTSNAMTLTVNAAP
ncbi:hypothetical protein [Pectobacterium phage Wc4-1]|uniref:Immunoglobulin domain-containing protein n=1 Tax=Pectobacterium phage Wc4 TaxID=2652428 RepID=A0A5P8D5E4_9CAUD|nr:hypothetical protein [Pectobacterium phage Wc4]QFP94026.1 hypothetical protein [Pectobacterium phage Wc4-1]